MGDKTTNCASTPFKKSKTWWCHGWHHWSTFKYKKLFLKFWWPKLFIKQLFSSLFPLSTKNFPKRLSCLLALRPLVLESMCIYIFHTWCSWFSFQLFLIIIIIWDSMALRLNHNTFVLFLPIFDIFFFLKIRITYFLNYPILNTKHKIKLSFNLILNFQPHLPNG